MPLFFKTNRFGVHITLVFYAVLLMVVLLILVGSALITRDIVVRRMALSLKSIVASASLSIDGDFHQQLGADPKLANTAQWAKIQSFLRKVQQVNNLEYDHIYTFNIPEASQPERLVFGVMLHEKPFVGHSYVLPQSNQALLKKVVNQHTAISSGIYEDTHGTWISAYAPILSSNGQVAGVLAADIRVDGMESPFLSAVLNDFAGFIGVFMVILPIGLLLVYAQARKMAKPIEQLSQMTTQLAAGNWSTPLPSMRFRELAQLGRSIDYLRNTIQSQIERLTSFNKSLEAEVLERTDHLQREKDKSEAILELLNTLNQASELEEVLKRNVQAMAKIVPIQGCLMVLTGKKPAGKQELDVLKLYFLSLQAERGFSMSNRELEDSDVRALVDQLNPEERPLSAKKLVNRLLPEHPHAVVFPLATETENVGAMIVYAEKASVFGDQARDILNSLSRYVAGIIQKSQMIGELSKLNHQLHLTQENLKQQSQAEIAFHATHDPLTGLGNRKLFLDKLYLGLARAQVKNEIGALLYISLDRFKLINESLGPSAGDLLLKKVADRLNDRIKSRDFVARLGGDQFALLLLDIKRELDAGTVAKRLLANVAEPVIINGQTVRLGASCGISNFPKDGIKADELLKSAETALNKAKSEGGGIHKFYHQNMSAEISARLEMEHRLHSALKNEEFVLYYQPQIDLKSGQMIGVECLIRWQSPLLGMISPGQFIHIAENTGLIVPMGKWTLKKACETRVLWTEEGIPPFSVAVNLSARQFEQEDLVHNVENILATTGVDPGLIELEITESIAMVDVDNTIQTLRAFKEMGLKLAIDDFGTGYSSLSYLKRFAIDKLKIDRSFVKDITSDASDLAIASAVINLSHALGLKVIAEGVEEDQQLEILRREQCDEIQGYYYSPPLPAPKLIAFFEAYQQRLEGQRRASG